MIIKKISEIVPDDELLLPYKTLRTPSLVNDRFEFVVQGDKSIQRLLTSPCEVVSILCSPEFYQKLRPWLKDRQEPLTIMMGSSHEIQDVIGYQMYQEVMAAARIPDSPTLPEIMCIAPKPWLFVATDGMSNAENMGTLIRNCSGFGVTGLIVSRNSCSPYLRRSVRCTMGTIFNIPIIQTESLAEALQYLKQFKVTVVGTFPHVHQRTLSGTPLTGDCCLIFGAEGSGLSEEIARECDASVTIPMHHGTDSLNVASASAVFLYEAMRQRGLA